MTTEAEKALAGIYIWRCDVTGNPVGTDTRMIGAPACECQGCFADRLFGLVRDGFTALKAERDEARRELETAQEIVAEGFEKDCWKALQELMVECHYDWRDACDGVSAEDARDYISTTLNELEKAEQSWRSRAEAAETALATARSELDRLAGLEAESMEAGEVVGDLRAELATAKARIAELEGSEGRDG